MIHSLTIKQSPAMHELHALTFDPAWSEADMQDHCHTDICLGYGNPLRGFIIIKTAADQGEILTLITHPDHRSKGIGSSLLQAGEKQVRHRNVNILFLEVAEDNDSAIHLYRNPRFEPIGKRLAYYRRKNGRVTALTFRKG